MKSMQHRRSALIGRDIVVGISEPWDFRSPDGDNIVIARVISFDLTTDKLCAEARHELAVPGSGTRGTRLVIERRYQGLRIIGISGGRDVPVGIAIVPYGAPDRDAQYAFIGSVRLADRRPIRGTSKPN